MRAVVGIGSNLGDRVAAVRAAIDALAATPAITVERISTLYETAPVGGPRQPDYVNAAVLLKVDPPYSAGSLVITLLAIEESLGRVRDPRARNHARTLDLDLLWTDGAPIDYPDAVVPHPRLHLRGFALAPLVDVVPDARDPSGVLYADILARVGFEGVTPLSATALFT